MRFYHPFLVAAAITIISSAAWADGIKMLPPSDFDDKNPQPCAGATAGVLQWDGANPIRCIPRFTGDKDGNISLSGRFNLSNSGGKRIGSLYSAYPGSAGWTGKELGITTSTYADGKWEIGGDNDGIWIGNDVRGDGNGGAGRGWIRLDAKNVIMPRVAGVGIGTSVPQSALDVNGEVRVANSGAKCTAANAGAIRFDAASKEFLGCDGTGWVNFTATPNVVTASANLGFSVAAGYVDCPTGYKAVACSSVVVPSGAFSCQVTPAVTNQATGRSACVQAGCGNRSVGDTGYLTTVTCVRF